MPGRTLLIGDSFSYAGIDLAMPLFERGAFAWFQYFDTAALARQIRASDTVVVEVSQRTLTPLLGGDRCVRGPGRGGARALTYQPGCWPSSTTRPPLSASIRASPATQALMP